MPASRPTAELWSNGAVRWLFGDFELDAASLELRRGDQRVAVEPQVFDVLRYLIEHRDRVVSKEDLLDNVWGDRFVSESALTSRIKLARRACGDNGREQRILKTVHGRGYRLVADVATADSGSTPAMSHDIAAELSTAPAMIVPRLQHLGLMEDSDAFTTPITDFLQRTPS